MIWEAVAGALGDDQWDGIEDLLPGGQGKEQTLCCQREMEALLADKAYDAAQRVRQPLKEKSCEAVIPSKANRKKPQAYDKELLKARHLIENWLN